MPLSKIPTKMKILDKKNMMSNIFLMRQASCFRLSKITLLIFFIFIFFFTKERTILTVLKQMILDEIKQSNSIKPQKIYFFHDFL